MDFGKFFNDVLGGVASLFLGSPAQAETPVVSPPRISPVSVQDWRVGVPEDAQCAVNVARHFLSPTNPDAVSVSALSQNGEHSVHLNANKPGQEYETIDFYWNTPRSKEESPMWSLQHSWDKSVMSGGELSAFSGYHEHGDVSGYLGGQIGPLFGAQASRFDYTYPAGTQKTRDVAPVAVPYLYKAIKSTCDILS